MASPRRLYPECLWTDPWQQQQTPLLLMGPELTCSVGEVLLGMGGVNMLSLGVEHTKASRMPCPQLILAGALRVVELWPGAEAFRLAAH